MPEDEPPPDADVAKLNSSLNEGLATCRTVVENYRTLLSAETSEDEDGKDEDRDGRETD